MYDLHLGAARESLRGDRPPTTAQMAGESSDDDEGPEEVSLQSGRDAAAQQRSQEKEVTQKSRCVPPSRLAQVACTLTRHHCSQPGEQRQEGGYGEAAQDRQRCAQVAALPLGVAVAAPCCGLGSAVSAEAHS